MQFLLPSWSTSHQLPQCLTLLPVSYSAAAPGVEYIAPAVSYVTPAPVNEYITLAPAVDAAPAHVVMFFSLAPDGYAAPATVGGYIMPVPAAHAVYAAHAPVVEYIAPAIRTAVLKISDTRVPDRWQSLESLVVAASKSGARQRPSVASLVRDEPAWLATVPEWLQSIESSIAALSVSVARQQAPRVAVRVVVVESLAKSSPAAEVWEHPAIEFCSRSSDVRSVLPFTCEQPRAARA